MARMMTVSEIKERECMDFRERERWVLYANAICLENL